MSLAKKSKDILRPLSPKPLINAYHYGEAKLAARRHSRPTDHMIVIGLVGTKGKTTTANLLWAALSADGTRVGLVGTANIRYGQKEEMNRFHMTMPGASIMQTIFTRMQKLNCKYVVMEVPSEGQTQYRHIGINFDMLIFTNVGRELMASHNYSFDTLQKHNKRVFSYMAASRRKEIDGRNIPKTIIANADAKYYRQYMNFAADKKVTFSIEKPSNYQAHSIKNTPDGMDFTMEDFDYQINLLGSVNVANATGAIAAARELGVLPRQIQRGFTSLKVVPGRMEVIPGKQPYIVVVDYAYEQMSMTTLMETAQAMCKSGGRIIVLLGAEGGGRDVAKRPEMGTIVGKVADYLVISNVDPYSDPPMPIIEAVAEGVQKAGKKPGKDLFLIEDRRAGIRKALELARKNDLVLITGKGAEQSIVIGGKSSPWDDRTVVREELKRLGYNK